METAKAAVQKRSLFQIKDFEVQNYLNGALTSETAVNSYTLEKVCSYVFLH